MGQTKSPGAWPGALYPFGSLGRSGGHFRLPLPSPPAEKAGTCHHQAGEAGTNDGAGDWRGRGRIKVDANHAIPGGRPLCCCLTMTTLGQTRTSRKSGLMSAFRVSGSPAKQARASCGIAHVNQTPNGAIHRLLGLPTPIASAAVRDAAAAPNACSDAAAWISARSDDVQRADASRVQLGLDVPRRLENAGTSALIVGRKYCHPRWSAVGYRENVRIQFHSLRRELASAKEAVTSCDLNPVCISPLTH
jgi:hypothetical protein